MQVKLGAYQRGAIKGRLLAWSTNNKLEWKSKTEANTLAYYYRAIIMAVL
jgi:hypothetical protein